MKRRKDLRPDKSCYVLQNLSDPSRTLDPAFLRLFPLYVHQVYVKQLQYKYEPSRSTAMNFAEQGAKDRHFFGRRKSTETTQTIDGHPPVDTNAVAEDTRSHDSSQQNDLRIIKKGARNNPQNNLSAMPSDFEHIFHYSETP